jgi:hypothetical protein
MNAFHAEPVIRAWRYASLPVQHSISRPAREPLKAVELVDESKAWSTGKQVVELLVARLEGNPQLASAALIVTDAWGSLVCELPFSDAAQPGLKALGALH